MHAFQDFGISALLVALAEMGDRTQLLTILLATRYHKPLVIILGVLVATLANHLLAAAAGFYISGLLDALWFRYLIGASFIAMALWVLIPDKESAEGEKKSHRGVFLTTVIAFFIVEMGDKTQIATVSLAARFHDIALVATGTTLGMMIANVPAVLLGEAATRVVPLKYVRIGAAVLFTGLGVWTLIEAIRG